MRVLRYTADEKDEGRALGRALKSRMGLSAHMVASLKPLEAITVNGENAHTNRLLRAGDEIALALPEETGDAAPSAGYVNVVYEDDDILVIDKDAPLCCQSSSRQDGDTLENRLMYRYKDEAFLFRPVNRLDKGTSGLMLAAKHAHAQYALQSLLHTDAFVREYLAVLVGAPNPPAGRVDAPIRKIPGATVKRETHPEGAPSATRYETVSANNGLALVRLRLETGRTHQIRVHMASLGCPVFGDFLYGSESPELPGRFALHSCYVRFPHPVTGAEMTFASPLPPALSCLL